MSGTENSKAYWDKAVPFYRLYQRPTEDHFYTAKKDEEETAIRTLGYQLDGPGTAGYIFTEQVPRTVPLYRLYNRQWIDHFYTTSDTERENAKNNLGFEDEGIAGYVFAMDDCKSGGEPLYRAYNAATYDHFYTTDKAEWDRALALGYGHEGIAGYVLRGPYSE